MTSFTVIPGKETSGAGRSFAQTINEERGARKAAELRRRFRAASRKAAGAPSFGGFDVSPFGSGGTSLRKDATALMIWIALAIVIAAAGSMIF